MKVSLLIAAMREEKTIGRMIETFLDGYHGDFEVLVSIPDEATYDALMQKADELGIADKVKRSELSTDGVPKGKPFELNQLMDMATGDFWLFGDGDTYFGKDVINKLLKHFDDRSVYAVTGRPVSADKSDTMMGYFGKLLADAAHHKRNVDLAGVKSKTVKSRSFFPVSGYLYATRPLDIRFPKDCLADDAYISYAIHNKGWKINYEPNAVVFVYYPQNLSDYFKQKKRSTGGYLQLWKYGVVKKETKTRSFWLELEYFWFPIKYAKNLRELFWSLMLYPVRLWLWVMIFWERKVKNKDFQKTWVRIDSSKG